jgi:hypothetical protein
MIAFWVHARTVDLIRDYRSHRGRAIADRIDTLMYENVGPDVEFPTGPQVFMALDQLTPVQREAAARIWDAHAVIAPSVPRLNDPRRVLLRFDLLTTLYREGVNGYRVYRAHQVDEVERFPVFVRHIFNHHGPMTRLLTTRKDLVRALRTLRMRGRSLRDHMIVEYCDASGPDGLFRKYAAFRVGSRIIPCHLFTSREWSVKSGQDDVTERGLDDALTYFEANPHAAWLRRVFEVARIDYGRVDYGMSGGVPQVWEINLTPTLGHASGLSRHASLPSDLKTRREASRQTFHERLMSAFLALDERGGDARAHAKIEESLLARLRAEERRARRKQRALAWLRDLYHSPALGRPVRAFYSLFPPR